MFNFIKKIRLILLESLSSYQKNNDLAAASSLAFSVTLALIPTLFFLIFLLSAIIGSSELALAKTIQLLAKLVPSYSNEIVREVQFISSYRDTIGILNLLILFWSVMPLVTDMRVLLGTIFKKKPSRPFFMEKLFDVAISIFFLIGLSAITIFGVFFTQSGYKSHIHPILATLGGIIPFLFAFSVVFLLYFAFSFKMKIRYLLIGSAVTTLLWFTMTPAFHLFLTYNPGYGITFGSFKSLFVIIIWVYYCLVVFLFGAEIAASLGRDETVFIMKLMEGKKYIPDGVIDKYVVNYEKGSTVFSEGDPGNELYCVLKGSVSIRKGDIEIGVIPSGKCFGGISFLLSLPRVADAVALEDVNLVTINNENINKLMNEYPEFVVDILREMAIRLKDANRMIA